MKKKRSTIMLLALVGLIGLSACSKKETTTEESSKKEETTITVNDSNGSVDVPQNPKKIVVFDNGSLDTLDALGKGKTVIGAPIKNLPNYLSQYKTVESAGGIKEPDLEKINELQPELILISGRQADYQKELKKIAPTLYLEVDETNIWGSTKQNIETLAKIYNEQEIAKEKIEHLEKEIADVKNQAESMNEKALIVLVNEGQLSAYGSGSRFGVIHDTFGFKQADDAIEVSTHGQSVSYEYVLEKNPDILFVIDRTKAIGGDDTKNNVAENELVKQTNAGKNGKIIALQPDVWYLSGGGIESMQLMIDDVKTAFSK